MRTFAESNEKSIDMLNFKEKLKKDLGTWNNDMYQDVIKFVDGKFQQTIKKYKFSAYFHKDNELCDVFNLVYTKFVVECAYNIESSYSEKEIFNYITENSTESYLISYIAEKIADAMGVECRECDINRLLEGKKTMRPFLGKRKPIRHEHTF